MSGAFRDRYGPWALVAGASEGLGAAFAEELARRGVHVALVARREGALREIADGIEREHGVETRVNAADLAERAALERVLDETRALDLGLLVYNAAYSLTGPFWDYGVEAHLQEIDVNVRGPLVLAHGVGARLRERGRGGILLMSSMAGFQGSAMLSHYAATKAYNVVLGEGLWDELRGDGVDALVCAAGATRTPNYARSLPAAGDLPYVPMQEPEAVAREALDALGRGPLRIPGRANRLASLLMRRILPRKRAVLIMGRNTRKMYGRE
jgi:uncharacterized protein